MNVPIAKGLKKIKSQPEYETRLKEHDRFHKKFTQMVSSGRVDKAQLLLPYLNKQYSFLRQWEKANGIYRFPAIKVGNVTYQAI